MAVAKGQCAYNGRLIPGGEYVCLEVTGSADYVDREEKWKGLPPSTTKLKKLDVCIARIFHIIVSYDGLLQIPEKDPQKSWPRKCTGGDFKAVSARAISELLISRNSR